MESLRSRSRRLRNQKPQPAKSRLSLEPLEERIVLTVSSDFPVVLPSALPIGSSGATDFPDVAMIDWQGQERLAADGQWIVSLDPFGGSLASQTAKVSQLRAEAGLRR